VNPSSFPSTTGDYPVNVTSYRDRALQGVSFYYAFSALGLSGVPWFSRSALISAVFLWAIILFSARGPWDRPYFRLAALFCIASIANSICVDHLSDSLLTLGTLFTALLGAIGCAYACEETRTTKYVLYGVIAGCALNILAGYVGMDVKQESVELGRATGLTGNSNALAVRLFVASFLVWAIAEKINRYLFFWAIVLPAYSLIMTGSRKALLMLPLLLMSALTRLFPQRVLVICAVSILLLGGGVFAVTHSLLPYAGDDILVIQRMMQMTDEKGESSANKRAEYISVAWQLWQQRPTTGYGLGQFASLSGIGCYSHNNYSELLVSGGIILLTSYYMFYLYLLVTSIRQRIWPVAMLVTSLIITDLAMVSYYDKTIWLSLALASLGLRPGPLPLRTTILCVQPTSGATQRRRGSL
jgi:O-antigen ligase